MSLTFRLYIVKNLSITFVNLRYDNNNSNNNNQLNSWLVLPEEMERLSLDDILYIKQLK